MRSKIVLPNGKELVRSSISGRVSVADGDDKPILLLSDTETQEQMFDRIMELEDQVEALMEYKEIVENAICIE